MRRQTFLGATLLTLIALVAACSPSGNGSSGTDASDASGASGTSTGTTVPATVMLADFMLEPEDMTVDGPSVTFSVTNNGPTVHNFSVRDPESGEVLLATENLRPGESATLTGELEPGEYETFCSLPGHESLGMQAVLTVNGP